ncbi:uncharacterized protein JCM6883_000454 [Sporobolomyces salmoneus]|uniref:uncharacterized protein n=1 Tax=Sporobolomyces salmoneus TaxID=183962 RepID=UPI003180782B
MVVWFLKLLIVSLNILSTHKALVRRPTSKGQSRPDGKVVPRRKRLKGEMMNWIVWVSFLLLEKLADGLVSWIPLYGTFKAFVLVMLLLSRGAGSRVMFEKLIKPTIKPWEGTLDFVGFVLGETLEITIYCFMIVPKWVGGKWKKKSLEPDVPSILRGLRQQNPTPRMAETLARSLERSQGSSDQINEKLSQPVTIRLNPVQASQTRRLPSSSHKPTISATVPKPPPSHPGLPPSLPPPSFSSAPFRPIKPNAAARTSGASSSASSRLSASTSRLPVASSSRSSTSTATSMYPSLQALQSLPPAPTTSFTPPPPRSNPSSVPSTRAPSKPSPPSSRATRTPPTRRSARKSVPTPDETLPSASAYRSPSSPAARTPVVPPTPAPPGAFNLSSISSASSPLKPSEPLSTTIEEMDVELPYEPIVPESKNTTARRKSIRKSKEREVEGEGGSEPPHPAASSPAKRSIETVDEATSDVETPRKKKKRLISTPEKGKGEGQPPGSEPSASVTKDPITATPRQRALGAISKLTADLMDEGEDATLSGKKKKNGQGKVGSLLARSSSGMARKSTVPSAVVVTRNRRGASKEEDEEEYREEASEPRKRKARRVETEQGDGEPDKEEEEEASKVVKKPIRKAVATRTKTVLTKPAPRTRTTRQASDSAPTQVSSSTTSTRRSTTTATKVRPPSRAPSPSDAEPTTSQAPKRRARRVLRRTEGTADFEEDVEVEGVAVVAGRRRR